MRRTKVVLLQICAHVTCEVVCEVTLVILALWPATNC